MFSILATLHVLGMTAEIFTAYVENAKRNILETSKYYLLGIILERRITE